MIRYSRSGRRQYRLAVFVPEMGARSETFIRRHVLDLLPQETLAIGSSLRDHAGHDWDAAGPLLATDGLVSPRAAARWFAFYGVEALLAEYLDCALEWMPIARECGVRFYVHAHGYDVSQSLCDPALRRAYLDYSAADAIITMSRVSRQRLVELGLPHERIHVVPYGVDVPHGPLEREAAGTVRVLAVGRLVPKKAPTLVLEAFKLAVTEVPQLRLDLVGDGPLAETVHSHRSRLGLEDRVVLHGALPNGAVRRLMQRADIFMQHSRRSPDTGDEEGLPVAILEAMAAALPVVATRHAGIPEAVEDTSTGYLVNEGDVSGMASRLIELAQNRPRRLAMGCAAWSVAQQRYDWERARGALLRLMALDSCAS